MKDPQLWKKIDEFEIDDTQCEFTFSRRLARDNKWTHDFSLKVIAEYKKFIYLCCVGYGEITPSDSVDQAWHLHLTYTKSYWVDFCQKTLKKQVHHNPTKGGESEKRRYSSAYDSILIVYEREFGSLPPATLWPDNDTRFGNIDFKRINLSDYWLIKRPKISDPLVQNAISFLLILFFIQSETRVPWGSLFIVIVLILFVARTIKGGRKGGKRKRGGGSSTGAGGFWGDFWGCSSDSGGGGSGCSSGCSSGCGGGGGCGGGD